MNNFKTRMDIDQIDSLMYLYGCAYEYEDDTTALYKFTVLKRLKEDRLIDHLTNLLIDLERFAGTEVYPHYYNDFIATCEVLELVGCEFEQTFKILNLTVEKVFKAIK